MSPSAAWVDGRLVTPDEPAVSAFDHALLTGDGVFETLRVYGGVPLCLDEHLRRLDRSAEGLGLAPPPHDRVRSAVAAVLEAAVAGDAGDGDGDLRLRITLTGGPGPLASGRGEGGPTLIVAVSPMQPWPESTRVITVPWVRNERSAVAGLKTVSYAENVVALAEARRRGASEAIMANTRGELCEGTGSNVFVALGGRLLTPPLSSGCLAGITRDLVLESGVAEEADLPLDALLGADEVFLTSSTREVQPVSHVDGRPLPECAGPLTVAAQDAFVELRRQRLAAAR